VSDAMPNSAQKVQQKTVVWEIILRDFWDAILRPLVHALPPFECECPSLRILNPHLFEASDQSHTKQIWPHPTLPLITRIPIGYFRKVLLLNDLSSAFYVAN
jgi:hypothetical protein